MARLAGLRSFVVIAAAVLGVLRLIHIAVPIVLPETRQGPIALARLDDVRRTVGFAPLLPAYHPEFLGADPASISVRFSPRPASIVVWRAGNQLLSVTQQRGGAPPAHPPLARPFEDVAGSTWWTDGSRSHLVVERGGFWIHLETTLSTRELRRFVDTLSER
jgi:hypothetical protein